VRRKRDGDVVNTQARQQVIMDTTHHGSGTDAAAVEEVGHPGRIAAFPGRNSGADMYTEAAGKSPRFKALLIALLVLVAAGVVWAVMRDPAAPNGAAAPPPVPPLELAAVDVAVVQPRVLTRILSLSGSMSPVVQATVKAKVSGEVETVTVREGQDVSAGDVIARIDTRNLRAEYERELAAVDKARAELELATLNRDKNRMLLEQRYISQNTYESTESAYAGSVASLKLAEAQARLAKIGLDDAVVRAPFDGTIARRLVEPGEKVSPDSSLVAIVDLRQMLLGAAVPAVEIPSVQVGQAARFRVGGFGDRVFEGTVQRINPITEDGSRAISVYIAVANEDRALKGGMFAQGTLQLSSTQPVLAVPQRALRYEASVPFVYTLEDGKIARKHVTVGTQVEGEGFAEVRTGLTEGERVIIADIGDRKPGAEAKVVGAEREGDSG
jgi:membrane fusion protein (multidrug efflux system)